MAIPGLVVGIALVAQAAVQPGASVTPADLAGAWSATLTHEGRSTTFALELEPGADGKLLLKATIPAAHVIGVPLGRVAPQIQGREVHLGPFTVTWDPDGPTLSGVVPDAFVPVYRIPLVLRRVQRVDAPPRADLGGAPAEPVWSFDAGSPLWAGPTTVDGVVYAGAEDGRLHALEARTGRERWSFQAGGAVRTRATPVNGALVFQADDGFVYALDAASGRQLWRARAVEGPIARLAFDDPRSRYDRFGSDVTAALGRLFVGTHDGHLLALDPKTGERLWEFAAGDSVLAAPSVDSGRVYFGSYDKSVYALDAASGKLLWRRDTQGAVVSTPAVAGDLLVVGNRCYDLMGIRAATGEVVWKRYLWFSWVESSPSVRDGIAYVGSSDAALVSAVEASTGEPVWQTDVRGWAWGQPAVTASRVYLGTSSQAGYPSGHQAAMVALDRATGEVVWRYAAPVAAKGAFGFPGSPAFGNGLVFVSSLDGRIDAFEP